MSTLHKYAPFFVSALLMYTALFFIYPHYQYYIDPDGTAYLTISQRYANGDYHHAINGYWSPWSCWLTALLITQGLPAVPASVIINALGATGFLFISQSFFLNYAVTRQLQWLLCVALSFFLCYAVFWQSFDDLWECFFLLTALRILLIDSFRQRPELWLIYGLLGTLAYFAKAYSFPFFILNTICCTYFIANGDRAQWLKICSIAITFMIVCSIPWIYALHNKYGIWTTSTSGPLNTSWYLVGHKFWKPGIGHLVPPAYQDSPYFWEDPWVANGSTPHFWNSWHLFGLQIARLGLNFLKLFASLFQLSVFLPAMVVMALFSLRSKKIATVFPGDMKLIIVSFLLFPLGYLLVNFEPRYIWYMLPPGLVLCASFVSNNTRYVTALNLLLPLSIVIVPALGMVTMYDSGKKEHNIAMQLKADHIQGPFTGDAHPRMLSKIAWFTGMPYYYLRNEHPDNAALLKEMRKDSVIYYIHSQEKADFELKDENGHPFPDAADGHIDGIKVYKVVP